MGRRRRRRRRRWGRGRAVQVDPIKPTLKAPGTERLKLKHDVPPLNFAFNLKLRRYTVASEAEEDNEVGRCRLKRVETRVESAWFQRLKLGYDEPLSNFAFILNLRRYTAGCMVEELRAKGDQALRQYSVVGRCRLKRVDPSVESAWFQRLEARI